MTTDTSAEALEESIFWLKAKYRRHGEIEDRIAAEQLEYFQAEKRRSLEAAKLRVLVKRWRKKTGSNFGNWVDALESCANELEALLPEK